MGRGKHSDILKYIMIGTALIIIYRIVNNWEGVIKAAGTLWDILMPCVIGVLIALFLYGPVKKLKRLYDKSKVKLISAHSLGLSMITVYLILFAAIGIIGRFVVPEVIDNITNLVINRNKYIDELTKFIENTDFLSRFESLAKIPEEYLASIDMTKVMGYVGVLRNIVGYVVNILVSIVISVYVLLDKDKIFAFLRVMSEKLFSGRRGRVFVSYVKQTIDIFYSYFCGLGLDSVVVGTISVIVFSIFKVPYAILLGIVIIIANMIPMFGPVIAGAVVYVVCAFAFGPVKAIWAIAFQLILGQLDGNIIQPHIVGGKVGVSPLLVLISVIVFGGLFGVAGMIIGVPVCATLKVLVMDIFDNGELDGSNIVK